MNSTINDVVAALNLIDRRFYEFDDFYFLDNKLADGENVKHLELRFMMEFSNKFSQLYNKSSSYEKLLYDFEIPKKFMWSEKADFQIRDTWKKLNERFRNANMMDYFVAKPDFLVHAGQESMEPDNQKLIIEAKVNPKASKGEIFKDIFNIFIYSNKYNFQYSVLLVVNIRKKQWIKFLHEYFSENYYCGDKFNFKKIFVIFKSSFDDSPEIYSIYDFLPSIDDSAEWVLCPKCGNRMIGKLANNVLNGPRPFWGCSGFPSCRGSRQVI